MQKEVFKDKIGIKNAQKVALVKQVFEAGLKFFPKAQYQQKRNVLVSSYLVLQI